MLLLGGHATVWAQTAFSQPVAPAQQPWARTQVQVGVGLAWPRLWQGQALLANQNRRRAEGSYGPLLGQTIEIGFYKPVGHVPGLLLGASFKVALTGSQPDAGYAEGYYFNPALLGVAAKYYPVRQGAVSNLFVRAAGGVSVVAEKTRTVNARGEQTYFHQFGIGSGAAAGIGYSLPIGRNKGLLLEPALAYDVLNTRVEVNGVGDDQWRFGVLNFLLSLTL